MYKFIAILAVYMVSSGAAAQSIPFDLRIIGDSFLDRLQLDVQPTGRTFAVNGAAIVRNGQIWLLVGTCHRPAANDIRCELVSPVLKVWIYLTDKFQGEITYKFLENPQFSTYGLELILPKP